MSALVTPLSRPAAPWRLFCLPPAGTGASVYRPWAAALGAEVELHAVQLPGREHRFDEPPQVDPQAVADAVAAAADRPYALFGHSMGARLAFEVTRRLRHAGAALPRVLYVAGCRPPDVRGDGPLDGLSALDDGAFLAQLTSEGALPAEVAADPGARELFLPLLRSDFQWVDSYRYTPDAPLPVPVVALAGRRDRAVSPECVAGWRRHTSAGFALHTLDGDHFFPQQLVAEVTALVRAGLTDGGPPQRVPLGRGDWTVWPDAVLRTTGFPADGLDLLAAPECAAAADDHLAGVLSAAEFDARFAAAVDEGSRQVRRIAADPRFREAVTWQNPNVLSTLDHLVAGGRFRPSVARHRELTVVRYWQRYCAKNETIGFFGPVCWASFDHAAPAAVSVAPGSQLVRQRQVHFEHWALAAYGDVLAADPAARMWLRPVRQPHVHLAGRVAYCPPRSPESLSRAAAAALAACDGTRTAVEVGHVLAAELGLPRPDDAVPLLDDLVARGLLRWDADLPVGPEAEQVLGDRVADIGDDDVRTWAADGLARLRAARDRVARAAGDPAGLAGALAALDAEFTDLTGQAPARRPGQAYAGRRLCYEDTARDLTVRLGPELVQAIAPPLELLLRAARWLCAALADAYGAALHELYDDLCEDPEAGVDLSELWFLAQGMLFGAESRPVDRVVADFQQRWHEVLGLADVPAGTAEVALSADALGPAVARQFPDRGPGWSAGRVYSPDLQICAPDADAVARGDYRVVLGELHVGWPVLDNALFTEFHPDPGRLSAALAHDLGPDRMRLLVPPDWPRAGGRLAATLASPDDPQLGIAAAPGADRSRLLPAAALRVRTGADGALVAHAPDGRCWPLLEVFSRLLAIHTVDSFRMVYRDAHTPRVRIDRLVVNRRTWRGTATDTGLCEVVGDRERFLAARRWRARLDLPERVFVRIGTETKPFYVDFRSPHYVRSLCSFLRSAAGAPDGVPGGAGAPGAGVDVTVTEMLPGPEEAWVPDADGQRYFSELRLQVGGGADG